jgi:hypothetical protein
MPDSNDVGRIQVFANRGGTIPEISGFLGDLETAYLSLYQLESSLPQSRRRWRGPMPPELYFDLGLPFLLPSLPLHPRVPASESLLPDRRLVLTRVQIESPGFWEVLGSLNPLQQIREYLNDRHKRRQDREFREAAETEKLRLENDLIQRQVWEKENAVLRERILVLKEMGYSEQEIRQLIWTQVGKPLAILGRHQDSKLIEGAVAASVESAA